MASISLTIPDDQLLRVYDAFAALYAYNPAVGLTKEDFFQQNLAQFVQRTVAEFEQRTAIRLAVKNVSDNVKLQIDVGYPNKKAVDAVDVIGSIGVIK